MDESLWIERSHYAKWLNARELRSQLPLSFQVLGILLNRTPRALERLVGRTRMFRCARWVHRATSGSALAPLCVAGVTLWLDLSDPRWIRAPLDFLRAPPLPDLLGHLLRPGLAFVDVGSNHGSFSAAAATLLRDDDLLVAVEPQPRLALATRLGVGGRPGHRTHVYRCALADVRGLGTLVVPEHNPGEAALRSPRADEAGYRLVPTEVRTLDDLLLSAHRLPDGFVLKIDAEGGEPAILRGATEVLRAHDPVLILEVNPAALGASGESVASLLALLRREGYAHYADFKAPMVPLTVDGRRDLPRNVVASKRPLACRGWAR